MIELVKGDITPPNVNVIVNAGNQSLLGSEVSMERFTTQ